MTKINMGGGTITASDIIVDDTTGFLDPADTGVSSPQYVRIEDEIISYTGITSTTTFTGITRNVGNIGGYPVTEHLDNTAVDAIVLNSDPPSTSDWVGWGSQAPISAGVGLQLRIWSGDNFGEDFILAPWEGDLYYWDKSERTNADGLPKDNPDGRAQTFAAAYTVAGGTSSDVPDLIRNVLISEEDRHTISFGCNDIGTSSLNPALVRWSDQGNPFNWTPSSQNTSGGAVLTPGSEIISAIRGRQEIIIWTDNALHSMRFIGPPYTFGFSLVSSPVTIISPNAAIIADSTIYWMGRTSFYRYSGSVETMPCSVSEYVFSDIDYSQRFKIFAAINSKFNEVIWFYPSVDDAGDDLNSENSRYVAFNYLEGSWYIGTFDMTCGVQARTAWMDVRQSANPIAGTITESGTPNTSRLVEHDNGTNAYGNQLISSIQSAYFDIGNGEEFMYFSRVIPDVSFTNSVGAETSGSLDVTLTVKDFPNDAGTEVINKTFNSNLSPQVNQLLVRARGRQAALKYTTGGTGFGWRIGDIRLDLKTDGRK